MIVNCKRVAAIADRVYIYDNSVDDAEARLLFRMTDGKPFKRYTDDIPLWAQTIIDWRFLQPGRPNPTHRIV